MSENNSTPDAQQWLERYRSDPPTTQCLEGLQIARNVIAALQARLDALHQEQEQLRQERDDAKLTILRYQNGQLLGRHGREQADTIARLTAILDQVRADIQRVARERSAQYRVDGWERESDTINRFADELTARLTEQ